MGKFYTRTRLRRATINDFRPTEFPPAGSSFSSFNESDIVHAGRPRRHRHVRPVLAGRLGAGPRSFLKHAEFVNGPNVPPTNMVDRGERRNYIFTFTRFSGRDRACRWRNIHARLLTTMDANRSVGCSSVPLPATSFVYLPVSEWAPPRQSSRAGPLLFGSLGKPNEHGRAALRAR